MSRHTFIALTSGLHGLGIVRNLWWFIVVFTLLLLTATPSFAQSACTNPYIVQKGDNMIRIAQQCGVTYAALLAANQDIKDPNEIRIGSKLKIPGTTEEESCGTFTGMLEPEMLRYHLLEQLGIEIANPEEFDLKVVSLSDGQQAAPTLIQTYGSLASQPLGFPEHFIAIYDFDPRSACWHEITQVSMQLGDDHGNIRFEPVEIERVDEGYNIRATLAAAFSDVLFYHFDGKRLTLLQQDELKQAETWHQVANATYLTDYLEAGRVTLQNGAVITDVTFDIGQLEIYLTEPIAEGDINGDGAKDYVVALVSSIFGTTGRFYSLHALLADGDGYVDVATIAIGDRTPLSTILIGEDGTIAATVDMRRELREPVVNSYKLVGRQLVLMAVGEASIQPSPTSCAAGLQTRLAPGMLAQVNDGEPNRLWSDWQATGDRVVVDSMPEGTTLEIIEGPECRNRYTWWRVRSQTSGKVGWTAENRGGEQYYLAPFAGFEPNQATE